MYQAISRGIRVTSHDDLINEAISLGKNPQVTVHVYKHAAVMPDSAQEPQERQRLVDNSVDVFMYHVAENKDYNIRRVLRMVKQCSVCCHIHYNRNVFKSDVDGSADCDYSFCRYQCCSPSPAREDHTTFDMYYSKEIIERFLQPILNIFGQDT